MRTVVGVLRGGPSSEYEVSLKSGASVLESLDPERYEPRDLFIDKQGQWHLHGMPVAPERALREVDVAFNTIHGEYGEDGRLHRVLDALAVPYTGSDAFATMLAFNKQLTRDAVSKLGVKVAHGQVYDQPTASELETLAHCIFRSLPHPTIVKPVVGGSSVGMSVAGSYHELLAALEKAFAVAPQALVEEFIKGKEATVGVIDNFRGEKTYALLPVEIVPPPSASFFDYNVKYNGETIERVPGNFSESEKNEISRIARLVHEQLGMSHYSRSDFIVSRRGIYFLEINSAPAVGLTTQSLLPKALAAVGATLSDFLHHVVQLALKPLTR